MSATGIRKCDRCDAQFVPELGCLQLDAHFYTDIDAMQGWNELDLCGACSEPIIKHIRPACEDLSDILPEES